MHILWIGIRTWTRCFSIVTVVAINYHSCNRLWCVLSKCKHLLELHPHKHVSNGAIRQQPWLEEKQHRQVISSRSLRSEKLFPFFGALSIPKYIGGSLESAWPAGPAFERQAKGFVKPSEVVFHVLGSRPQLNAQHRCEAKFRTEKSCYIYWPQVESNFESVEGRKDSHTIAQRVNSKFLSVSALLSVSIASPKIHQNSNWPIIFRQHLARWGAYGTVLLPQISRV